MIAKTKEEFERAADGLPRLSEPDLSAEVVCIEPAIKDYWVNGDKLRCIVRRKDGRLFVADYD